MSGVATAVAVAGIGGALLSSSAQKNAAETASQAQIASADKGIEEQRRQFDDIQKLLAPYVGAGVNAIGGQQDLIGLSGPDAQAQAIQGIQQGPEFGALVEQGEEAILQNASATGGLRGGNTQRSLAQFRPQILSQLINQQYNRLGGLANTGQASAAGQASFGQQTGTNVTNLLGQQGTAGANAALSRGAVDASLYGDIGKAFGTFAGSGVF
jgi:hypothetical protein